MTDNENKHNDTEIINDSAKADEQSTIFVDPANADSSRKREKKKRQSSVKKQRIAIIVAVVLIAIVLAGFFIGSAIHNKHVELGAKWDAFKIAMEENLSDKQRVNLAKYDTFADWLAEHHNDADVRMLIKENKTVKKILDDSPALNDLVKSIAKQKDFANKIDALSEDPAPAVKLIDGEVLGTGNRIYIIGNKIYCQ